jgi:hypothetical protein
VSYCDNNDIYCDLGGLDPTVHGEYFEIYDEDVVNFVDAQYAHVESGASASEVSPNFQLELSRRRTRTRTRMMRTREKKVRLPGISLEGDFYIVFPWPRLWLGFDAICLGYRNDDMKSVLDAKRRHRPT